MWLLPTSNSIPNLFVCSGFHPTWQIGGALFSSKPRRWAHWSSPPRSRGLEKKMHAGYLGFERDGGGGAAWFWQRGVWCQGLLCVPLFVWACQIVCRVPSTTHPLSDWQTPAIPKPPCEHDSDSRGPDLSLWISLLFPWWTKGAWNSGFGFFLYLFPSGHIRCFQFEAGCGGINSGCASCCRVATGRQHHSNTCGCHLNLLSSITMFSFLKPLQ